MAAYRHRLELQDKIKRVLPNLYRYLRDNLTINKTVSSAFLGYGLIDFSLKNEIYSLVEQGKSNDAFEKWYNFAFAYYDVDQLKKCCVCLKEIAQTNDMMRLQRVAETIEEELSSVESGQWHTRKRRKIELVKPDQPLYLPVSTDLRKHHASLQTDVIGYIQLLNDHDCQQLIEYIRALLSFPPYFVIEIYSCADLLEYVRSKNFISYNILEYIIEWLSKFSHLPPNDLSSLLVDLDEYKKVFKPFLETFLTVCEKESIEPLPQDSDFKMIAIVLEKEPECVLLMEILRLERFFVDTLGIQAATFEGFQIRSVILYFMIPKEYALRLSSILQPHLAFLRTSAVSTIHIIGQCTINVAVGGVEPLEESDTDNQGGMLIDIHSIREAIVSTIKKWMGPTQPVPQEQLTDKIPQLISTIEKLLLQTVSKPHRAQLLQVSEQLKDASRKLERRDEVICKLRELERDPDKHAEERADLLKEFDHLNEDLQKLVDLWKSDPFDVGAHGTGYPIY